jgi:hypothetical protein
MVAVTAWMKELVKARGITPMEYRVGISLALEGDFQTGLNCRPGNERLEALVNSDDEKAIRNTLRSLEDKGWIKRVHQSLGRGNASIYRLSLPPVEVRYGVKRTQRVRRGLCMRPDYHQGSPIPDAVSTVADLEGKEWRLCAACVAVFEIYMKEAA